MVLCAHLEHRPVSRLICNPREPIQQALGEVPSEYGATGSQEQGGDDAAQGRNVAGSRDRQKCRNGHRIALMAQFHHV